MMIIGNEELLDQESEWLHCSESLSGGECQLCSLTETEYHYCSPAWLT